MAELVAEIESMTRFADPPKKKVEANSLRTELLDYKERCEQLLMTICKKDKVVDDLEGKCLSLENRAGKITTAEEPFARRISQRLRVTDLGQWSRQVNPSKFNRSVERKLLYPEILFSSNSKAIKCLETRE